MNQIPRSYLFLSTIIILMTLGCSYNFSNSYYRAPLGVKTLYIESIFDTSKSVIPHQILWEEVQKAFGRDGRVLLTHSKNADAYLRIQITDAKEAQFSKGDGDDSRRDNLDGNVPPLPTYVPNLKKAGEFAQKGSIKIFVKVEAFNLRTKEVLLSKSYSSGASFNQIYGGDKKLGQPRNYSIRAKEVREKAFQDISKGIAENIKRDFLIRKKG